jgi:hypothetical protein
MLSLLEEQHLELLRCTSRLAMVCKITGSKLEAQMLFNLVVGIAAFFGGWTLNNITRMLNRLDEDIRDLPHLYVSKDDYKNDIHEIKGMLGKIFDKLEGKADKV